MSARRSKVQQAYGYAVCLVCIITGLITLVNVLNSSMDLARPVASPQFGFRPSAETFEQYKMERAQRPVFPGQSAQPLPPDSVLRPVFEAEHTEQLARAHWEALKSFITSLVVLLVAIVLFVSHWRWLRGADDSDSLPDARLSA